MKYLSPFFFASAVLGLAGSFSATAKEPAFSASMNVTPLRLELPREDVSTQMMIQNRAKAGLDVQLRVFEWTQINGEDQYRPTNDVAVSPSIVSIEPGRTQAFHVVAAAQRSTPGEKRYRVVIDELPGNVAPIPGTTRTMLRLTVPLFVDSDTASAGDVSISAHHGMIRLENSGEQTVRLAGLSLENAAGPVNFSPAGRMRYIHGGSFIELALPEGAGCASGPLRLKAMADSETIDAVAEQNCP